MRPAVVSDNWPLVTIAFNLAVSNCPSESINSIFAKSSCCFATLAVSAAKASAISASANPVLATLAAFAAAAAKVSASATWFLAKAAATCDCVSPCSVKTCACCSAVNTFTAFAYATTEACPDCITFCTLIAALAIFSASTAPPNASLKFILSMSLFFQRVIPEIVVKIVGRIPATSTTLTIAFARSTKNLTALEFKESFHIVCHVFFN